MSVLKLLTLVLATDIHFLSKMSCAIRLQLVISNAWFQNLNDNIKHFRIFLSTLVRHYFLFSRVSSVNDSSISTRHCKVNVLNQPGCNVSNGQKVARCRKDVDPCWRFRGEWVNLTESPLRRQFLVVQLVLHGHQQVSTHREPQPQ